MNTCVKIEELLKSEGERGIKGCKWADRVKELIKYRDDNGHCNVPCRQSSLGWWVNTQRREFKKSGAGKASSMSLERVNILNNIGFVWDASDKSAANKDDDAWMRMFEKLMEYKEQHGDCLVPKRYEDNRKLGRWVSAQRHLYHCAKMGKSTRMTKERQHKLVAIGFEWKVKRGCSR